MNPTLKTHPSQVTVFLQYVQYGRVCVREVMLLCANCTLCVHAFVVYR